MKNFQNLMNIDNVEVLNDNKQKALKGGNGFEEGCPPGSQMTDSPKG